MNTKPTHLLAYAGTIFLAILSIAVIVITPSFNSTRYSEATISVSGEAEVQAVPDIARFSFSVSEVSDTPEEAQEVISEKINTILSGLDELGVNKKDIKTNSYTINPRYEWVEVRGGAQTSVDGIVYYPGRNQQVLTGYDVRQNVSVTIRDLEVAPDALTLFAQSGVENLSGPNFEVEEIEELKEEAREEAIEMAKKEAQRLAKDLGVKLDGVVSFSENNGGYYPEPYMARAYDMEIMEESMNAPQLPTGEQDIVSKVYISYRIK